MRNINKLLIIPYLLWMVIFIIIPVILLVYFHLWMCMAILALPTMNKFSRCDILKCS